MYTDLEPQGDEQSNHQGNQSGKHKGIKHVGYIDASDQVETKCIQDKGDDYGYIPVPPILQLHIVDDLLIPQEQDKHKGNEEGTYKNNRGNPGLDIKGQIGQVGAGVEQKQESDAGNQQRMEYMRDNPG
jgi:hypothetical protein